MNAPDSTPYSITFFGDLFPSNHPYTTEFGLGDNFNQLMTKEVKSKIREITKGSSIVFANLESPVVNEEISKQGSKPFLVNEKAVPILKELGLNLVSLANNHIMEQGREGFKSTMETLRHHDLQHIGELYEGKPRIVYFHQGNTKIGIAAFNDIHDLKDTNYISSFSIESVDETIARMKQNHADIVIISIHWGKEYVDIPSHEQIMASRHFIDNQANIIIGHHPHIIQPVEKYKNGLILYSLGNFIFDFLFCKAVKKGLAVTVHFNGDSITDYDLTPLELGINPLVSVGDKEKILMHNDRILKKMSDLEKKGPDKYQNEFLKSVRRNHFLFRIYMKVHLLRLLITKKNKKTIFKTLSANIVSKFKNK